MRCKQAFGSISRLRPDRDRGDGAVAKRGADEDVQDAGLQQRRLTRCPILRNLLPSTCHISGYTVPEPLISLRVVLHRTFAAVAIQCADHKRSIKLPSRVETGRPCTFAD